MAKKEKGILTKVYAQAKEAVEQGNLDHARDLFDFGILKVANKRFNDNLSVDEKIRAIVKTSTLSLVA